MATTSKKEPTPILRFPVTQRIHACEQALDLGLHLIRDNYHMWGIRVSDKRHVWLCSSNSYDGLWREACNTLRDPEFDVLLLPYATKETKEQVTCYNPRTGEHFVIDQRELRSRRGQ